MILLINISSCVSVTSSTLSRSFLSISHGLILSYRDILQRALRHVMNLSSVALSHPCIRPLSSIVGRAKVADNIGKAKTSRSAGETRFYRYEIDVYEEKDLVLALRTGVI